MHLRNVKRSLCWCSLFTHDLKTKRTKVTVMEKKVGFWCGEKIFFAFGTFVGCNKFLFYVQKESDVDTEMIIKQKSNTTRPK